MVNIGDLPGGTYFTAVEAMSGNGNVVVGWSRTGPDNLGHAFRWTSGVGMTDLVKRATPRASELGVAEYRAGLDRLDRLCSWLRPEAVVMVGLAGWRAATDRRATIGWQDRSLGDRPVYVMPSTSGLNARTSLDELTDHLRHASGS